LPQQALLMRTLGPLCSCLKTSVLEKGSVVVVVVVVVVAVAAVAELYNCLMKLNLLDIVLFSNISSDGKFF